FGSEAMKPHGGSVISRVFGQKGELRANVILPDPIGNTGAGVLHGQTSGYLGSAHEPFFLNADPALPDFKVADLEVPKGLSQFRLDARKKLLDQVDELLHRNETRTPQTTAIEY